MIETLCECGHHNEVPDSMAGGIVNCARCGRAVPVEGLRDPMWRTIQLLTVVAWAGATAWTFVAAGPLYGLAVGIGLAVTILLLSRAF